MISETDIILIQLTDSSGRWFVHDGFFGWSYSAPQDPTPITRACALRILNRMIVARHPDAIVKLTAFPNALDYADANDDLYLRTGNNRLIAYLNPTACIFEKTHKPEQDYDI